MKTTQRASLEAIRKKEILQSALTIISERGSVNVTLDDIAQAAGFSKGGITYYYPSKEVLFKEVFEYFLTLVYEYTKAEIKKFDDPLEKILAYRFMCEPGHRLSEIFFPMLFEVLSMANINPEYSQVLKSWANDWVSAIAKSIEQGNENGQFKIENIEDTARLISATMEGIGARWTLCRDSHTTEWAQDALETAVKSILNVHQQPVGLSDQTAKLAVSRQVKRGE